MKAYEAQELMRNNLIDKKQLEECFSSIRGAARQGLSETWFVNLKKTTIEELERLGYKVILFATTEYNETNVTVAWGHT